MRDGLCIFPIFPEQTVSQFLDSIRDEDNSIKTLVLFSVADDARASHSITLEELLKDDVVLEVDGKRYLIEGNERMYSIIYHNMIN